MTADNEKNLQKRIMFTLELDWRQVEDIDAL